VFICFFHGEAEHLPPLPKFLENVKMTENKEIYQILKIQINSVKKIFFCPEYSRAFSKNVLNGLNASL
jgi:hypothetical protein